MSAMLNRLSSIRLPKYARGPKRVHLIYPTDFDAAVHKRAAFGSKSLDRFERMLLSLPGREIDEENTELPWPDKYLQPQGSEEFTKHVMDMQWRIIQMLTQEHYGSLPSSKTIHWGRLSRNDREYFDQANRLPSGLNNHPIGGPVFLSADPEENWLVWETFRPRFEKREAELAAQKAKFETEQAEKEREKNENSEKEGLRAQVKASVHELGKKIEAKQARTLSTVPEQDEITPVEDEDAPLPEEVDELNRDLTPEEERWLFENRHTLLKMHSKEAGLRKAYRPDASLAVVPETETAPPEIPVIYRDQEDTPVGDLAGGRKRGKKASGDGEGKAASHGGISKGLSRLFRKRTM